MVKNEGAEKVRDKVTSGDAQFCGCLKCLRKKKDDTTELKLPNFPVEWLVFRPLFGISLVQISARVPCVMAEFVL